MGKIDNKYDLGFFPTPAQPLLRLSEIYSGYNIYIKEMISRIYIVTSKNDFNN